MDLGRNRRVLEACAWTGLPFLGLFLVGFWFVAGFVPPPSPEDGPVEVARAVAENATWIRAGMLIATAGAVLTLPWQAAIAIQMRRAEGPPGVLTVVWVMAAALFCLEFVYPLMFWMVTAYRPEIGPEITQRLNDLAWISLLGVVGTAVAQAFALGTVVVRDTAESPAFPRWYGYFCFWAGLLFLPATLIVFFRSGPFAWNGIIAWWTVLSVFAGWILVTTALTVRAIDRDTAGPSPDPAGLDDVADRVRALEDELRAWKRPLPPDGAGVNGSTSGVGAGTG
jgi:hypothetical protein